MLKCYNGCNTEIYFDVGVKGPHGKQIPLEVDTGLPHDCPNKKDTDEKFIGQEIMDLESKESGYYPKY